MAEAPLPDDPALLRRLLKEAGDFLDFAEPIVGRFRASYEEYRADLAMLDRFEAEGDPEAEREWVEANRDRILDRQQITEEVTAAVRRAPLMLHLLRSHFSDEERKAIDRALVNQLMKTIRRAAAKYQGLPSYHIDRANPPRIEDLSLMPVVRAARRLQGEIATKLANMPPEPPARPRGRPRKNAERDARIIELTRTGESDRAIARKLKAEGFGQIQPATVRKAQQRLRDRGDL